MYELTTTSTENDSLLSIPVSDFLVIKEEQRKEISTFLANEHENMLNNFSKSQSNFMDTLMVFNAQTPIRNLRQISAEIEKKKMALAENGFRLRKEKIELQKLINEYNAMPDDADELDRDLLIVEIEEKKYGIQQAKTYVEASLKTILNQKQQFETIMENKGVSDITELDFEAEEEEYHIKQALHQAFEDIVATGRISVGNNKYLLQIGLMPNTIHNIWSMFISGKDADNKDIFYSIINGIYVKYKGCSKIEANRRGMEETFHENSVVKQISD